MAPFICNHARCTAEKCTCPKDNNKASGPPVFCGHGTLIRGNPSIKVFCGCIHEDIIERGNPGNRDPMDPTWTYEGSCLKELIDEGRKCPPSYCQHGKCIEGDEQGKNWAFWSAYYKNNA